MRSLARFVTFTLLAAAPAVAQEVDVGGDVDVETRGFPGSPSLPQQFDAVQLSVTVEPRLSLRLGGRHDLVATPFARLDGEDAGRSHFDVRELYWRSVYGDWEILFGFDRVFWGVTESLHLVDVVNQADLREDLDEEDKLGQPMLRVEWQRPWGRLSAFALIGFRERTFPGTDGRLRLPLPVADDALYPDGERAVDFALRYSHYFGDFDLGLALFNGTGREPGFRVDASGESLVPVYSRITQASLDLQYTRSAWLWKAEALVRSGHGRTFGAAVLGFEHTRYQLAGTAADLGLLVEYIHDDRDETAPPTAFARGLFLGTRLAFNDVDDTTLLAGAVVDLETGSVAGRLEASRRLTGFLTLELEARLFANVSESSVLHSVRRDSFLMLRFGVGL